MQGAADGLWERDIARDEETLSPRAIALLQAPPPLAARLHADDLGAERAALQSHLQHGAPLDIDLRLTLDLGAPKARQQARALVGAELAEVGRRMAALTAQARPRLAARKAASDARPPVPAEPLDTGALAQLRQALEAQNLGALDLFAQLAPALQAGHGDAALARLDLATAIGLLDAAPDVSARSSGDAPA